MKKVGYIGDNPWKQFIYNGYNPSINQGKTNFAKRSLQEIIYKMMRKIRLMKTCTQCDKRTVHIKITNHSGKIIQLKCRNCGHKCGR